MRSFTFIAVLLVALAQNPAPRKVIQSPLQQPSTAQKPIAGDSRGTEQSPLVVKVLPPVGAQTEANQEVEDRWRKAANDRNLVVLTGVLAFVGFLQLLVFGYQAYKLRQTVESAGEQAEAMERPIEEAARSATAMENIAATIQSGNQEVMRAYLTVTVGTALHQERREGQSDLKFEGRPQLLNTGNTPARKVRIRIAAEILPIPIPEGFAFPLPDMASGSKDAGIVGAHQTYILAGTVKDFVPERRSRNHQGRECKSALRLGDDNLRGHFRRYTYD